MSLGRRLALLSEVPRPLGAVSRWTTNVSVFAGALQVDVPSSTSVAWLLIDVPRAPGTGPQICVVVRSNSAFNDANAVYNVFSYNPGLCSANEGKFRGTPHNAPKYVCFVRVGFIVHADVFTPTCSR